MEFNNINTPEFAACWSDHLCQEFLDHCQIEGADMVQVFGLLSTTMVTVEESLEALKQILIDQEVDELDFIVDYDEDLGCFEIDPFALELELITA